MVGGTIALDSFKRDFGLTDDVDAATRDTAQANITSMFAVGAFFGALITFPIAEKIGRRLAISTACLIIMAGGAMMAGAQGSCEQIPVVILFIVPCEACCRVLIY